MFGMFGSRLLLRTWWRMWIRCWKWSEGIDWSEWMMVVHQRWDDDWRMTGKKTTTRIYVWIVPFAMWWY